MSEWRSSCIPASLNVAISGSRDEYAHTHSNDTRLVSTSYAITGDMGFNGVLGESGDHDQHYKFRYNSCAKVANRINHSIIRLLLASWMPLCD